MHSTGIVGTVQASSRFLHAQIPRNNFILLLLELMANK